MTDIAATSSGNSSCSTTLTEILVELELEEVLAKGKREIGRRNQR